MFTPLEMLWRRYTATLIPLPIKEETGRVSSGSYSKYGLSLRQKIPCLFLQAPDYYDVITKPMDFSTMSDKVEGHKYQGLDEMEEDFNQMIENCMNYNSKETKYYRAAVKIRDQVRLVSKLAT